MSALVRAATVARVVACVAEGAAKTLEALAAELGGRDD